MLERAKQEEKQGYRDVPALHNCLEQDCVLIRLPALCSLDVVGLKGGREGSYQPVEGSPQEVIWHHARLLDVLQGVHGTCRSH